MGVLIKNNVGPGGARKMIIKVSQSTGGKMTINYILPYVLNPLSDRIYDEYFGLNNIDISNVFGNVDAGTIYTAESSDESLITTSIDGTTLTLTEDSVRKGFIPGGDSCTGFITLTATNGAKSANDVFNFTINGVNDAPAVINPIPNQNLSSGFGTHDIYVGGGSDPDDPNDVYYDKDGNTIYYSTFNNNESVVTVSMIGAYPDASLRITEVGTGDASITLYGSDLSLSGMTTFNVNVS